MKSGEQDGVCGKRGDSAGGEIVQDRSGRQYLEIPSYPILRNADDFSHYSFGDSHNEICYYAL